LAEERQNPLLPVTFEIIALQTGMLLAEGEDVPADILLGKQLMPVFFQLKVSILFTGGMHFNCGLLFIYNAVKVSANGGSDDSKFAWQYKVLIEAGRFGSVLRRFELQSRYLSEEGNELIELI
jgi:hypothetical protein